MGNLSPAIPVTESVERYIGNVGNPVPEAVSIDPADLPKALIHEVKAIIEPTPWRFVLTLVATWILIAAALFVVAHTRSAAVSILCIIFVSTRQNVLGLLVHEQVHRLAGCGRWVDYAVDATAAFWLLISVDGYRKIHLAHHRHFFTEHDPDFIRKQGEEWEFPQPGRMFAQTLLKDLAGLNVLRFLRGKNAADKVASSSDTQVGLGGRYFKWAFYAALICGLTITHFWLYFLIYWLLPLLTVTQVIVRWGAICEHRYNLVEPSISQATPLIILRWWERLIVPNLNFNYHIYHHIFPNVAFSRLPAVHAIFVKYGLVDHGRVFNGYGAFLQFLLYGNCTSRDARERKA